MSTHEVQDELERKKRHEGHIGLRENGAIKKLKGIVRLKIKGKFGRLEISD